MKNLKIISLLFLLILNSCFLAPENQDFSRFINGREIEGKYLFVPDSIQARKLGMSRPDTIWLEILPGVTRQKNRVIFTEGRYLFSRKDLLLNTRPIYPEGKYVFFSSLMKVKGKPDSYNNHIAFINRAHDMDLTMRVNIEPDSSLYINTHTSDPVYEVIEIMNFKKIK